MTYVDETESRTVSTLTMSARISESGRITPLPETVRPVRWTELWARSGKSLDRIVQLRVKAWVEPLLKAIETKAMPADSAHLWKSQEQWRAATIRETRRKATDQAHARVTSELRREALAEIEAEGSGFWPVRWEESTKVFLVQGEWTVTVSVSGTDHTAVRSAFASDLPPLIADIVADAQNRIPRPKKTVPISASTDTPAKVRKAWKRDRAKGTAPKAANGAYTRQLGHLARPGIGPHHQWHRHTVDTGMDPRQQQAGCHPVRRKRPGRDATGFRSTSLKRPMEGVLRGRSHLPRRTGRGPTGTDALKPDAPISGTSSRAVDSEDSHP
ncbi:hypothetical protein ACFQFR_00005 [Streptomyces goshikiensis]